MLFIKHIKIALYCVSNQIWNMFEHASGIRQSPTPTQPALFLLYLASHISQDAKKNGQLIPTGKVNTWSCMHSEIQQRRKPLNQDISEVLTICAVNMFELP